MSERRVLPPWGRAVSNDFGWGAIGLVLGAIITGLFGWLAQRSKGETDQSVAVLAEWSKLNEAISDRLATVEKEFAEYRTHVAAEFEQMRKDHAAEIEAIRRDHSKEIDEMRTKHRAEMKAMRELNEGLQRQIAQNSQSAAHLIGEIKGNDDES